MKFSSGEISALVDAVPSCTMSIPGIGDPGDEFGSIRPASSWLHGAGPSSFLKPFGSSSY